MATLNLGRIKPVFRGAYAGGTAYVVDDIVTSGNETFICILASTGNATSNATYWTKLAAKGTDGTDVGTTITTQGDILFRDGSGLQRLAKGTASQVLTINSGATAPEWADSAGGGKIGQVVQGEMITRFHTSTNATWLTIGLSAAITPVATSSKILALVHLGTVGSSNQSQSIGFRLRRAISGGATSYVGLPTQGSYHDSGWRIMSFGEEFLTNQAEYQSFPASFNYLDSPSTTSATTYEIFGMNSAGGDFTVNTVDNAGTNTEYPITSSRIQLMEVLA